MGGVSDVIIGEHPRKPPVAMAGMSLRVVEDRFEFLGVAASGS